MNKNVKFFIIFLLIIIIVIYIINNYFRIAIVGSGPVTEEEITEINKYNIIAVMNYNREFSNIDIPIKATHYFTRYSTRENSGKTRIVRDGGWFWGWDEKTDNFSVLKPETYDTIKYIILLTDTQHPSQKRDTFIDKVIKKYNNKKKVIELSDSGWHRKNSIYKFNNKKYKHDKGPTTGIVSINYMLEKYPLHTIHIYGMNSTKVNKEHDIKSEKEIIKECRRCKLHKTHKDTYH